MTSIRVTYAPRSDATAVASELDALSAVYKFLIESAASKKAAEPTQPGDRDDTPSVTNTE
jgi:hypothetical protein